MLLDLIILEIEVLHCKAQENCNICFSLQLYQIISKKLFLTKSEIGLYEQATEGNMMRRGKLFGHRFLRENV